VVSVTDPYGRNLDFLDRSHYFSQVPPYLYSLGCGELVPDPLLLRQSGYAENRTRTSGSVVRNFEELRYDIFKVVIIYVMVVCDRV
jgi:hypothetical protein